MKFDCNGGDASASGAIGHGLNELIVIGSDRWRALSCSIVSVTDADADPTRVTRWEVGG